MADTMSPEEYELLVSLGGANQDLSDQVAMQREQAQMLRGGPRAGAGGMAGNVYVASNPLQHVGDVLRDKLSMDKMGEARAGMGQMNSNQQQQNQMVLKQLLGRPAGAAPNGSLTGGTAPDPYAQFRQGGMT